jgi:carbonic anhydrase/acetyltransferase-like protein (isoleucine patch superfamily)
MNLILIGGGSLALEVLSFVSNKQTGSGNASGPVIHIVCADGAREGDLRRVHPNLNVVRSIEEIRGHRDFQGLVCVGDPAVRFRLFREHEGHFSKWATIVHPSANVMPTAQIGEGAIIAPNSYVGPLAKIGPNVLVNVGASIGHDAYIGHSSVISPQAAINGFASCGVAAFVGAAATMNPGSSLGAYCKLSAGSVFSGKADEGFLLHGNPAKGRQMFRAE